jgi:hypothetical protein
MIKKIASVVLVAAALSGCSTLKALGVSDATVTSIQQAAVSVCGFLPTVETVVNLVSGGIGTVPGAVAQAICTAVAANQAPAGMAVGRFGAPASTPKTLAPGANVNGIAIQGSFVR